MDLKRVNRMSQKYKDIVNGFVKEVQDAFPSDISYYNIPSLVTHLILLHFHTFIESHLFTDNEIDELLNLDVNNLNDVKDEMDRMKSTEH